MNTPTPLLLALPQETIVHILSFTGARIDSNVELCSEDRHTRKKKDILQLFCICHSFSWLSNLWITAYEEREYDDLLVTFNIWGKDVGPCCFFYCDLIGYVFSVIDANGASVVRGNHFYNIIPYSNLGFLIVNGNVYEMNDAATDQMASQVAEQLKKADPIVHQFFSSGSAEKGHILVRFPLSNYPEYQFTLPETLKLETDERREKWRPKTA